MDQQPSTERVSALVGDLMKADSDGTPLPGAELARPGPEPARPLHQLYSTGDTYLDDDVADAVKPGLVLGPQRHGAGEDGVDVEHAHVHHEFRLDPAPVPAGV